MSSPSNFVNSVFSWANTSGLEIKIPVPSTNKITVACLVPTISMFWAISVRYLIIRVLIIIILMEHAETKVQKLDIDDSIGIIIRTASKSLEKALGENLKKELSLSGSKWKVLAALSIEDGISQTNLADLIFVEGPTLVSILDKLEEMELVQRKPDPNDRRNNLIYTTKKSQNMMNTIVDCVLKLRKTVTQDISPKDLETTKNVLRKMTLAADRYYVQTKNS
ncbi:MAG: hypothetical protein COW27_05530 [Nitrosopumilales archaeon CG15_BIG_FIL_POST_REV_8_21_14_020_37_12]|nr:MAG: hypothetical protein COW27_05530 [Nitrosopumilales archaeon CG15_BIG_FIL_POST_REV_8_21_14_020_37_12]